MPRSDRPARCREEARVIDEGGEHDRWRDPRDHPVIEGEEVCRHGHDPDLDQRRDDERGTVM